MFRTLRLRLPSVGLTRRGWGAGVAVTTPHLYWRVMMLDNWGGDGMALNEVQMRATAGGANLCTGGTPSVSNATGGGSAVAVFDGNTANFGVLAIGATNQWVQYQFASAVSVAEVALTMYSERPRFPKNCQLQYSDDGVSFTTAFSFIVGAALINTTYAYPATAPATGLHLAWRAYVDTNGGDTGFTYMDELEFRASAGGADQTVVVPLNAHGSTSGRAISQDNNGGGAFDNSTAGVWGGGASGSVMYCGFIFPSAVKVEEVAITNVSTIARSPHQVRLQYSDDEVTWADQKTMNFAWTAVPQTVAVAAV